MHRFTQLQNFILRQFGDMFLKHNFPSCWPPYGLTSISAPHEESKRFSDANTAPCHGVKPDLTGSNGSSTSSKPTVTAHLNPRPSVIGPAQEPLCIE